ncbi:uncharacterized protein LOC127851639 [Dreissena polymorpha]|uniref:uncharacterized protein LOC127851639 n=1 Tax=Dreissena polymorpha TaxID=45954 RepID=UPI00226405C4|nr:uncharacterized protein LOC127851639 [Dreissena polymorpha]
MPSNCMLMMLMFNVELTDVANQVSALAEVSNQIHLRPITALEDRATNRQTLVLVVNQACEAGKHLDRVRKWLPGCTIVEANIWDCECFMEKTGKLTECLNCLEHMEAKNAYLRRNYGGRGCGGMSSPSCLISTSRNASQIATNIVKLTNN